MDQSPHSSKVLYNDDSLRLTEALGIFRLEYLTGGEVQFSEQYTCRLCALRALLLATIQLEGHCHCSPNALRLESANVIESFAGGRN